MNGRLKNRILIQKKVTINGNSTAFCFDINDDGMYIQSDLVFRAKEVLDLEFEIGGKNMAVRASIRHIEPGFGFGVKFISLSSDKKSTINHLVSISSAAESNLKVILLLDGKEQSRSIYKFKLQQDGFSVIEASSGSEAFKILQVTKPDLVVLDNQIDGIGVFKLLQFMRTKEELKHTPAVILTTRFVPEEVNKGLSLGVKDYLVKATTTPNKLSEKIKLILDGE